jgi:hypothetical protein
MYRRPHEIGAIIGKIYPAGNSRVVRTFGPKTIILEMFLVARLTTPTSHPSSYSTAAAGVITNTSELLSLALIPSSPFPVAVCHTGDRSRVCRREIDMSWAGVCVSPVGLYLNHGLRPGGWISLAVTDKS